MKLKANALRTTAVAAVLVVLAVGYAVTSAVGSPAIAPEEAMPSFVNLVDLKADERPPELLEFFSESDEMRRLNDDPELLVIARPKQQICVATSLGDDRGTPSWAIQCYARQTVRDRGMIGSAGLGSTDIFYLVPPAGVVINADAGSLGLSEHAQFSEELIVATGTDAQRLLTTPGSSELRVVRGIDRGTGQEVSLPIELSGVRD